MSITPTHESALADLPAKPRVHELSKRIGISNKELLTALAERGLAIKSASSSVPADVAREVIEAFLAPGEADGRTGGAADEPAPASVGTDADNAEPAGQHPDLPTGTRPLFLPPDVVRVETDDQPGDGSRSDDAEGAQRPAGSGRRRRGRTGRRGGAGQQGESEPTLSDQTPDRAAESAAPGGPDAPASAEATHEADASDDHAGDERAGDDQATDDQATDDPAGDDPAGDDQADASGRGRRRRRGRRGRGRVSDDAAGSDGEGTDEPGTDDGAADDPAAPEATGTDATVEESADTQESDETDESDERGSSGTGSRRRRRRRRRVTGEDGPREDDPDNTVVHVREPRLSAAGSGAAGSGSTGTAEVQGVRGSTR